MPGDDDLCCQICCEPFDEDPHSPRILGCCLNTLCLQCAKNLALEQEGFVTCPACRTEQDVEGDVENLPINELVLRKLRAAAPPPPPGGGGRGGRGDFHADASGDAAQGSINTEDDEWSIYPDDDDYGLAEERFERADVVAHQISATVNIEDYDFYEEPSESPAIPAEVPAASDRDDADDHLALPPCPLCDEHFDAIRKPWALACPHVLCESCLSAMHGSRSASGARISCPVCATETDVAHDWTACLTPRGHSERRQRPQPAAPDPLGPATAGTPGAVAVTSGAADDGSEGSFWAWWLATLGRWCFCRAR
ncbi:uncharacterized protein LOC142930367 [Petromyzon marinus]|uniref:uncharacterized protein LOC142930367 n=1 Tax=Petromyzon marinus TaxID=7757 RepID=UPI003F707F1D